MGSKLCGASLSSSRFLEGLDNLGFSGIVNQILRLFQCSGQVQQSFLDLRQSYHSIHRNDGAIFICLEEVIGLAHAFLFRMIFANPIGLKLKAL